MFSPLEQFDAIKLFSFYCNLIIIPVFEFSLFNIIIPFFLLIFYFIFFFFLIKCLFTLIPNSIQCLFETIIIFVFNIIKQQIGSEGYIFFPFLFSLFNFILFTNLLSLLPFGIALTSHIIMIVFISLSTCFSIFVLGIYLHIYDF